MNAGTRLALFGACLLVAFGAAFGLASVIVPDGLAEDWVEQSDHHGGEQ